MCAMQKTNRTGTIVGRLSKQEIQSLIIYVDDKELKEKLLRWLELTIVIHDKLGLVISEPLIEVKQE